MDTLIDNMMADKWEETDASKVEGFIEYQIMRQHQQVDANTIRYLIQTSQDSDPIRATCEGILKGKDPVKNIGTCEIKVDGDMVVAINLDGDCVVKKS